MSEQLVEVELGTRRPRQRCRSCDAPVTFWRTRGGRWMPFNGDPSPKVQEGLFGEDGPVLGFLPASANHFLTCPDAAKWRRG